MHCSLVLSSVQLVYHRSIFGLPCALIEFIIIVLVYSRAEVVQYCNGKIQVSQLAHWEGSHLE